MAVRIDEMLQPGERALYRVRTGTFEFVKFWLVAAMIFVALDAGLSLIGSSLVVGNEPGIYSLLVVVTGVLGLFHLYLQQVKIEVVVTDRRLLFRRGLIPRRETEVALGDITRVHGLEAGSPRPVRVECVDGAFVPLDQTPDPQRLGQAVARAAGQPLPSGSAPIAERAAGALITAGLNGVCLGFLVAILTMFCFASLNRSDPIGIIAFALAFTMVVPGTVGLLGGWAVGSLLTMLFLRPVVTAEEMREAIYVDLDAPGTVLQTDDFRPLGRRMLLRFASLVYGQRIAPLDRVTEERAT